MKIKIEKNVPVYFYNGKYPLDQMEIGDSFVVPKEMANRLRATSSKYAKHTGTKFVTRCVNDDVRIWRIY